MGRSVLLLGVGLAASADATWVWLHLCQAVSVPRWRWGDGIGPGGSHRRRTALLGWSWARATSLTTASVQQDEEPKISLAPVRLLDSLQGGLANICLIVTPCFVHYQPPKAESCPKEQFFLFSSWLNLGIAILSSPGHVHPPALSLTLCRCYLREPNPCTDRLQFASGRGGTKRARPEAAVWEEWAWWLCLQKDYAPTYFVRRCDFSSFFVSCYQCIPSSGHSSISMKVLMLV